MGVATNQGLEERISKYPSCGDHIVLTEKRTGNTLDLLDLNVQTTVNSS